ncbi:hypothetical protein [Pseudonocardia sp. DLS-67]
MSSEAGFAPQDLTGTHRRSPRLTAAMRVTATLLAVVLLAQAVTAGLLLSVPGGRAVHAATVALVMITGLAQLVAAILVWRPGAGSPRFAIGSALLLVLLIAEVMVGEAGVTVLHVPLGAALLAASAVLVAQVWSR